MTEDEFRRHMKLAYEAGRADARPAADVRTFSDGAPRRIGQQFASESVERFASYFAADPAGRYPGIMHRRFGLDAQTFADRTGLALLADGDKWYWTRPAAAMSDAFADDMRTFASERKDGDTWETNGRKYKREGGKTVRVAAQGESGAKPEPASAPEPKPEAPGETPPAPAKPTKPDPQAVHEELKAAHADPDSLTPEKVADLTAKLKALTVDQLKAIQAERGVKGGSAKADRVQKLIDGAKKATAKPEPKTAEPTAAAPVAGDPVAAAKSAKAAYDAAVAAVRPLVDRANAAKTDRARAKIDKQLEPLQAEVRDARRALGAASEALAAHNGHDYGVYTVDAPGAAPKLVSRHPTLDGARGAHAQAERTHLRGDLAVQSGRDITDEFGQKGAYWHSSGAGKEVYVAKVPREKGGTQPAEQPAAEEPEPKAEPAAKPIPGTSADAPHAKARAALDALGIDHSGHSDEEVVAKLKAAFAPQPKGKPAKAQAEPKPKKEPAPAEPPATDAGREVAAIYDRAASASDADIETARAHLSRMPKAELARVASALGMVGKATAAGVLNRITDRRGATIRRKLIDRPAPAAKATIPAGHTSAGTHEGGAVVSKDPKTGGHTTHFAPGEPERQAERLGAAVTDSMRELKLFPEFEDGLVPIGHLAQQVKNRVPDATDSDVLAALKHMRDTRQIEGHGLNEVQKLATDPKIGALGDGKNLATATLWDKDKAVHYFMLPKGK